VGDRSLSRELALKVLYQMEHGDQDAEAALTVFAENFAAPEKLFAYTRQLVLGVEQNRRRIDEMLNRVSRKWRVERMSRVDRNILRLACYEIYLAPQPVPPKAAISEALELSKRYAEDCSCSFINGVLDSLINAKPAADAPAS